MHYKTNSIGNISNRINEMVGEITPKSYSLEQILSEQQVDHVVKQSIGEDVPWQLEGCEVKPAADGLVGYLGDHIKATLRVRVGEELKKIHLFMKHLPIANKPKAELIDEFNFFRREMFLYNLLEKIGAENSDPNPWCSKVYTCTDINIVMPDLAMEGYTTRDFRETLDLPHLLLTVTSIARFHAAFTNYETKKILHEKRPYSTYQEHTKLLSDPAFCDSPWLRSCAKLTANFLDTFSLKYSHKDWDLESKLITLYIEACESCKEEADTLNVLIHNDLWVNNILFKYENEDPINALLIDFQCLGYAPQAFDVMTLLYLTTSRKFREQHEREILLHYYKIFVENLDVFSKKRLEDLGYNEEEFLMWCEKSRMFGVVKAIAIFPYTLMDPKTGQKTFDDPETYEQYMNEDRSAPVIAHAKRCDVYRKRQLEVSEEFVERYVLKELKEL